MLTQAENDLGKELLTERGMQWLHAHGGDPFGVLLRAEEGDHSRFMAAVHGMGPVFHSRTGAFVTGNHRLGTGIRRDPRITPVGPEDVEDGNDLRRLLATVGSGGGDPDGCPAGPEPAADAVECATDAALDRLGDEFDLVTDLSRPVLATVLGDLSGIAESRRAEFGRSLAAAAPLLDAQVVPPRLARARELIRAVDQVGTVARGPDAWLAATQCLVGAPVAVDTVSNAVAAALLQPAIWQQLRTDPSGAEPVVEETLRYDPPIRLESWIARADLDLADRPIPAGSTIVVHIEAANRDPELGPGLDRFVPARTPAVEHLSLRGARYLEAVAPLVRMSAAAILRTLAARRPRIEPAGSVVRRLRAPVTSAIVRFPIRARRTGA